MVETRCNLATKCLRNCNELDYYKERNMLMLGLQHECQNICMRFMVCKGSTIP